MDTQNNDVATFGRINLPVRLRDSVHLVHHGQRVRIHDRHPDDPDRLMVSGSGTQGQVPVKKEFVQLEG